jgi:methyl-accepting chemotaxis protein
MALITLPAPREGADPRAVLLWLVLALAPAFVTALVLAAWLDRGIVARVRMLARSVASGQMAHRPGHPLSMGWGELADLTEGMQASLYRQRQLARAGDELQRLQRQIVIAREAVERWTVTERWHPLAGEEGPLRPVIERLNLGFARGAQVLEQNQQAAVQVRNDLLAALEDARESAEQAEHGFVEATALLTTVRELQRLSGELSSAAAAAAAMPGAGAQAVEQWRVSAAGAIEEMIGAAGASVEYLGSGLMRVQEIAEQVHLLANRATVIAINAVTAGVGDRAGALSESATAEMKQLAREVRTTTERVAELSRDIERGVESATERMRGLRERVASRLEQTPATPAEPSRTADDVQRLLDRVREMVQDATRKCERLSAASERSSRAADSLVQKLEDSARDMEGLAVRLAPAGATSISRDPSAREPGSRPSNLRAPESDASEETDERGRGREEMP